MKKGNKEKQTAKVEVGKTETELEVTTNKALFFPASFHPKTVTGVSSGLLINLFGYNFSFNF